MSSTKRRLFCIGVNRLNSLQTNSQDGKRRQTPWFRLLLWGVVGDDSVGMARVPHFHVASGNHWETHDYSGVTDRKWYEIYMYAFAYMLAEIKETLKYRRLKEMADVLRTTSGMQFSCTKTSCFDSNITEVCCTYIVHWNYTTTCMQTISHD